MPSGMAMRAKLEVQIVLIWRFSVLLRGRFKVRRVGLTRQMQRVRDVQLVGQFIQKSGVIF